MILIISENNDLFTDQVIEWLLFYGIKDIVRINDDDYVYVKEINIQENKIVIETNRGLINFDDIDVFWYRRGKMNHPFIKSLNLREYASHHQITQFLDYEWHIVRSYIFYHLQQKKSIGHFFRSATNKLINLQIAKECGLDIPDTFISENFYNEIYLSRQKKYNFITKPIGEATPIPHEKGAFTMLTKSIEVSDIQNIKHFPSLFQEEIHKHFEIRTFVLYNKLYSMAIFSQNNESTKTDYRHSVSRVKDKNRRIPYTLPSEIENKIVNFMKKIRLDTGSIDLIKTHNGKYVFLEINSIGNIEMVNDICNYSLDKEIANKIRELTENGTE